MHSKTAAILLATAVLGGMTVPVRDSASGVVEKGWGRGASGGGPRMAHHENYIRHGHKGWTLAKYEWRKDGTGRFLYVRNNGERREVIREQKGWSV